ncbi:hypothetical protein PIB30_048848 [Stylosanthes scabra]|uniref:Uncharacterized protein n=1 Tax=Stylosanthes scabra TaxID=79078 RepID=A0ABU6VI76_9FABA|nr:hypothetical protein [Stylosanthes scabra]
MAAAALAAPKVGGGVIFFESDERKKIRVGAIARLNYQEDSPGTFKKNRTGRTSAGSGDEAGPTAQAGQAPQDAEDCINLIRSGTLPKHWERVLLPMRCAFLMPVLERLMLFMIEAGFRHAIQLRTSFSMLHSSQYLWSVGGRRHTLSTSRGVSAPSLYRMWRITWVSARTRILLVVACGILILIISNNHGIW